ncbi:MAG TPA: HEAT repeat domain-containing protein [Acidimicrobiales bacterium]|nr:HEAT repeat domain-containing protein [Acidimicrobiales bacterium]
MTADDPDGEPGTADDDAGLRRRRAVLAGHGGDHDSAALLSTDLDPTVRSAALGALSRLGALDEETLLRALGDPDPGVRRRACTLAGRTRASATSSTVVADALARSTADTDPSVVEAAAWALGEAGGRCAREAVAELCRVAADHRSPVCREAAVAALGAVGAPDTLPVILAALDDTPNIRRRAAVALAAFDDPAAEDGLRRCLGDRDWQVRQAAEELLAAR